MLDKVIKKLARSHKYQSLYSRAKEIGSIRLFTNLSSFSRLQSLFLDWLELYNSLYSDLAMGEEYISEEVIKDDLRMEAYLVYKSYKRKNKNIDTNKNSIHQKISSQGLGSVIFKKKRQ